MPNLPPDRRRRWPIVVAPIALAAVVSVVWVLGNGPPPPAPRDAAVITVSDAGRDRARLDEQLAMAREAESRGDLDLAIAAYQEVYQLAPGADPLYRIAELEERRGNRMVAARYYRRYLDAAPAASDRDRVVAHLAALETPPADAGVDAPRPRPAPRPPPTPAAGHCMCNYHGESACPKVDTPSCRCMMTNGERLCQVPPPPCAEGDRQCARDPTCPSYTTTGTPDQACSGYHLMGGAPGTGKLRCDYCVAADVDALQVFAGPDGVPCTAFARQTGERIQGKTTRCETR